MLYSLMGACSKLASIIVLIPWRRGAVASMARKNMKLFMEFVNNLNTIKIRGCYEGASKALIRCLHNKVVYFFLFFSIFATQQLLCVRMIDAAGDASTDSVSNNKAFFVMPSRNRCKLIRRRYSSVDLSLNNWEFIMYDLRGQAYWVCSWRWCLCSLQTSSSWVKSMSRCLYLVAHSTSTIDCSLAFWTISTSSRAPGARARKGDASPGFHLCSMRDASKSIDQEHESLTSRSR